MTEINEIVPYRSLIRLLEVQQIKSLHTIQTEAIQRGLFFNQNFLVCSPSGSGKTLIAELAIAKHLLNGSGVTIYLVPYKALATEKKYHFSQILTKEKIGNSFLVKTITSDTEAEDRIIEGADLIITTFEKFDTLVRQNHPILKKISLLVIDEVHEISSSRRGAHLEILLTRILDRLSFLQVICLSATIANYESFAKWLSSFGKRFQLLHAKKRPIKLDYEFRIYKNKLSEIKRIVKFALEEKGQVIVFVNRRKDCLNFTQLLKSVVVNYLSDIEKDQCIKGVKNLKANRSVATVLKEVIPFGIAYHNASLSVLDRRIVEKLYKEHNIKVLIATSTLAAGVNTPARFSIISDIVQHRKTWEVSNADYLEDGYRNCLTSSGVFHPLSSNQLHQMLGRAGRLGYDQAGKGIILLRNEEEKNFVRSEYFQEKVANDGTMIPKYAQLTSKLKDRPILQELVLLIIHENPGISKQDISKLLQKTFFASQLYSGELQKGYKKSSFLELSQFFSVDSLNYDYFLDQFGAPSCDITRFNYDFSKITPESIIASISSSLSKKKIIKNRYHCRIDIHVGMQCSCNPMKKYFNAGYDLINSPTLCTHLTTLMKYILGNPVHPAYKYLKLIIPLIVQHESIYDFLEEHGLIAITKSNDRFTATKLGQLAINLYIFPHKIIRIKNLLCQYSFSSVSFMLDKIIMSYCFDHSRDPLPILSIANKWIEETTVESIIANHPKFGLGDLFSLTNDLAREASIFESITNHLHIYSDIFDNCKNLVHDLKILSIRLKHGVKEELVDLFENLSNLSRNNARKLFQAGYHKASQITNENSLEVAQKSKIKLEKIKEITGEIQPLRFQTSLNTFLAS
ncbi:hypothetical protein NEF87_004779 [Candidatus Lokiarchaeum ossiferum]|uniref:DEAD/DEAH box helicase n=1 Tax=Candidatus Lokiarchaeum ossiferum TaxID=2951803 RepID=A0ABY6I1B7_9ARCH|nr:hypothetical protein NEF87_004779 [Candidatus Lokiarchaeum sp. B-35]